MYFNVDLVTSNVESWLDKRIPVLKKEFDESDFNRESVEFYRGLNQFLTSISFRKNKILKYIKNSPYAEVDAMENTIDSVDATYLINMEKSFRLQIEVLEVMSSIYEDFERLHYIRNVDNSESSLDLDGDKNLGIADILISHMPKEIDRVSYEFFIDPDGMTVSIRDKDKPIKDFELSFGEDNVIRLDNGIKINIPTTNYPDRNNTGRIGRLSVKRLTSKDIKRRESQIRKKYNKNFAELVKEDSEKAWVSTGYFKKEGNTVVDTFPNGGYAIWLGQVSPEAYRASCMKGTSLKDEYRERGLLSDVYLKYAQASEELKICIGGRYGDQGVPFYSAVEGDLTYNGDSSYSRNFLSKGGLNIILCDVVGRAKAAINYSINDDGNLSRTEAKGYKNRRLTEEWEVYLDMFEERFSSLGDILKSSVLVSNNDRSIKGTKEIISTGAMDVRSNTVDRIEESSICYCGSLTMSTERSLVLPTISTIEDIVIVGDTGVTSIASKGSAELNSSKGSIILERMRFMKELSIRLSAPEIRLSRIGVNYDGPLELWISSDTTLKMTNMHNKKIIINTPKEGKIKISIEIDSIGEIEFTNPSSVIVSQLKYDDKPKINVDPVDMTWSLRQKKMKFI